MTQPGKEPGALFAVGILLFVFCAGFPAMEMAHKGFGIGLDPSAYLLIATAGGALGGLLIADGARLAGLLGGAVAGPCGLLGLSAYLTGRQEVFKLELIIVQMLASLPGVGVFFLVKMLLEHAGRPQFTPRDADETFRPGRGEQYRADDRDDRLHES
jgi:hypothetical protein